jgi:hypothetical protein
LREREKVDVIYGVGDDFIPWGLRFDFLPKVFVGEGEHSTARMVKNGNFARAK